MATLAQMQATDWQKYIVDFLDTHSFSDGLEAAAAIAVQSIADHGAGDTLMLEIQAACEFNRRIAAGQVGCAHVAEYGEHAWANDSDTRMHCVECGKEESRQRGEWLEDFQAAGAR